MCVCIVGRNSLVSSIPVDIAIFVEILCVSVCTKPLISVLSESASDSTWMKSRCVSVFGVSVCMDKSNDVSFTRLQPLVELLNTTCHGERQTKSKRCD